MPRIKLFCNSRKYAYHRLFFTICSPERALHRSSCSHAVQCLSYLAYQSICHVKKCLCGMVWLSASVFVPLWETLSSWSSQFEATCNYSTAVLYPQDQFQYSEFINQGLNCVRNITTHLIQIILLNLILCCASKHGIGVASTFSQTARSTVLLELQKHEQGS